jgi:hypothetical protein
VRTPPRIEPNSRTRRIHIYVEGEENRQDTRAAMKLRIALHRVFSELDRAADERRLKIQYRLYKSRDTTYRKFLEGLAQDGEFAVLLVDSEGPVAVFGRTWEHVAARDGWARPAQASDAQCQLMVQAIEAWLVADREALATFYGPGFHRSRFPPAVDVESVPKDQLVPLLEAATKDTQKGRYHKVRHLAPLLSCIDLAILRKRSPHYDRVLKTLGPAIRQLP